MSLIDAGAASQQRTSFSRAVASLYPGSVAVVAALLANFSLAFPAEAARGSKPATEASNNRPVLARVLPRRTRAATPAKQAIRVAPRPRTTAVRTLVVAASTATQAVAGNEAIRPAVVIALGNAACASSADPALLLAMAWQESRLDPLARNPQSSARGLMQFTRGTWLEVVRDFGPKHGLTYQSALLLTDHRTGEISTRRPRHLTEILKLRDNPRLSAIMAAERISRKQADLAQALGRVPTAADLYMVHLLGPVGAQRFLAELQLAPSRPVTEAVGTESLKRNLGMFMARHSGRPFTLGQVYQTIEQLIDEQRTTRAELLASLSVPAASGPNRTAGSAVEVANAR